MSIYPSVKSLRPSPLQRRSTLKRSIDDTDLMETPSSPSKRSRVTFDSDVEIVSADDEEDVDPQVVKELVRRAIERHRAGDNEPYERYRSVFTATPGKPNAPSTKSLRVHLQALLSNVANLTKDCSSLIDAVINSDWIAGDDAYYALFVRFLGNLAAAQRGFHSKIMQMLVNLLGPQKTRRIPGQKIVRQGRIHKRTFQAIRHITLNVPSTPGALADRITAKLQFEFEQGDDRMSYVRNFMQLIDYVPELTSDILNSILQELIKLDVSIQDSLDDEDDAEEDLLQHMSASQTLLYKTPQTRGVSTSDEDDDLTSSEDSDVENDADKTPEEIQREKLKENVKQVDIIMDILFEYYDRLVEGGSLEVRNHAISQLINQFHSSILPTYGSRHPQFLIFHFAQTNELTIDEFIASCIELITAKKHSPIIRHAAAGYFAGFVGRGAHVPSSVVHDCMDLLCDQLNMLREKYDPRSAPPERQKILERQLGRPLPEGPSPDLRKFGDFYAIFQAILYIFCFRWRELASPLTDFDEDNDLDTEGHSSYRFSELLRETLRTAIYVSTLNPLRICTPVIVEQFAKLTNALELFTLFPRIEENKQVRIATPWRGISDLSISQPDRDQSWIGDNGMMEGYFPYDPYHLPISKHWIAGDYVEWQGIPGEDEVDSDSDDDGMELIDDEDVTDDDV